MIKLQNVTAGYSTGRANTHNTIHGTRRGNRNGTERDTNMVLHDIDLNVNTGEFIALIGPNGSGKSTLLKAMSGQLPISGGTVCLQGKPLGEYKPIGEYLPIGAYSPRERALSISYFPQSRPTPNMSVSTLVAHGRFPHLDFGHVMNANDREIVGKAIMQTGLTELANRPLSSLSGGERQRAYLAMLIAQETDILLLDEPGAFLDIRHQLELMDILRQQNNCGKAIIFAAHDLPLAFSYAMRIVLMENGRIIDDAPPESISGGTSLERVFGMRLRRQDDDSLFNYILTRCEPDALTNDALINTEPHQLRYGSRLY